MSTPKVKTFPGYFGKKTGFLLVLLLLSSLGFSRNEEKAVLSFKQAPWFYL
jgi:hypothetical protein